MGFVVFRANKVHENFDFWGACVGQLILWIWFGMEVSGAVTTQNYKVVPHNKILHLNLPKSA